MQKCYTLVAGSEWDTIMQATNRLWHQTRKLRPIIAACASGHCHYSPGKSYCNVRGARHATMIGDALMLKLSMSGEAP